MMYKILHIPSARYIGTFNDLNNKVIALYDTEAAAQDFLKPFMDGYVCIDPNGDVSRSLSIFAWLTHTSKHCQVTYKYFNFNADHFEIVEVDDV